MEAGRIELPSEIEPKKISTRLVNQINLAYNCPDDKTIINTVCLILILIPQTQPEPVYVFDAL